MSGCDATSACDLFVRLHCASGGDDWTVCGETSKIQDDNYPIWTEVFTFPHFPGTNQVNILMSHALPKAPFENFVLRTNMSDFYVSVGNLN